MKFITSNPRMDLALTSLNLSFEAFMAVMFQVKVFRFVTQCSVVVGYQRFGCPWCLQPQGEVKMEAAWTSETSVSLT
jgi:hypothetical protein